jgi:hypothetical protein
MPLRWASARLMQAVTAGHLYGFAQVEQAGSAEGANCYVVVTILRMVLLHRVVSVPPSS